MKTLAAVALLLFVLAALPASAQVTVSLDDIQDQSILEQASYLFGYQMGDAARTPIGSTVIADLDMGVLLAAVREGLNGDSLRYEPVALRRVTRVIDDTLLLRSLRREAVEDTSAQEFLDEIATNTAATDSFFTSLQGTEGLQTTESGLRYVVLQEGEGEPPDEEDICQVKISTSLMTGQELRGMTTTPDQPVPLAIGTFAVEGLNEALKDMAPGESRRLFIPPSLAFGIGGLPAPGDDRVPPATALILDVTLTAAACQGAETIITED